MHRKQVLVQAYSLLVYVLPNLLSLYRKASACPCQSLCFVGACLAHAEGRRCSLPDLSFIVCVACGQNKVTSKTAGGYNNNQAFTTVMSSWCLAAYCDNDLMSLAATHTTQVRSLLRAFRGPWGVVYLPPSSHT